MTFETTRFGSVKVDENIILSFPDGIIGIPHTRWVLISVDEDSPFIWLQALDDPEMALPVTIPEIFYPSYVCEISQSQADELKITAEDHVEVFCVVNANKTRVEDFTINLGGPIVINSASRLGLQTVNPNPEYSVQASLWAEAAVSSLQVTRPQLPTATPGS